MKSNRWSLRQGRLKFTRAQYEALLQREFQLKTVLSTIDSDGEKHSFADRHRVDWSAFINYTKLPPERRPDSWWSHSPRQFRRLLQVVALWERYVQKEQASAYAELEWVTPAIEFFAACFNGGDDYADWVAFAQQSRAQAQRILDPGQFRVFEEFDQRRRAELREK